MDTKLKINLKKYSFNRIDTKSECIGNINKCFYQLVLKHQYSF